MKNLLLILLLVATGFVCTAQSLFESSFNEEDFEQPTFDLGGFVRTSMFANEKDFRSLFAECSIELSGESDKLGSAFTEIHFGQNRIGETASLDIDMHEAYITLSPGKFDIKIGQQVVVWGRADGFNPTNNLTPHDFRVFSPDEDDKRLSNFLVHSAYNFKHGRISFDWIPVYCPSELPLNNASLPTGISWATDNFPDPSLSDGNIALKFSLEKAAFDGSISWFRGYHKMPGLNLLHQNSTAQVFRHAHQTEVFGFDFSTSLAKYGLRGEFAFSVPKEDDQKKIATPNKQLEYTIGLDREWGNFNLIGQYIGKHVFDFTDLDNQGNLEIQKLLVWNRLIFAQTHKTTHSVSLRPACSLRYQTIDCEILTLYNCTTEELYLKPKITFSLRDNIKLAAGAQIYEGENNTLFDLLGKNLNAGFVECKLSF